MNELLNRWSKKYLSQILFIFSGILLIIFFINRYTDMDVSICWIKNMINFSNKVESNIFTWILGILLYDNLFLDIVLFFHRNTFDCKREEKYYERLVIIYSIKDVLELVASIYGLIFVLSVLLTDGLVSDCYSIIVCIGVFLKFIDAVWHHYYFTNQKIVRDAKSESYKD